MIIGSYHPHHGDLIINRFHWAINLNTSSAICCGGLITVISCVFAEQFLPEYTFFSGDSFRLTLWNLRVMHMLRPAPGGNVWMIGISTYFKVTHPDVIALVDPISETLWVLPSNIPPPLCPCRSQQVHARPCPIAPSSSQNPDRPSTSTVKQITWMPPHFGSYTTTCIASLILWRPTFRMSPIIPIHLILTPTPPYLLALSWHLPIYRCSTTEYD